MESEELKKGEEKGKGKKLEKRKDAALDIAVLLRVAKKINKRWVGVWSQGESWRRDAGQTFKTAAQEKKH